MTSSYLVYSPSAFTDAVARPEIEVLDYIFDTHAKPASLVTWLLLDCHRETIVELGQRLLEESYRVGARTLEPFNCFLVCTNL